jgi:small subunit ribosomal protein S21
VPLRSAVLVIGFFITRHRVSRTRRIPMGVRIVLADQEPIDKALRRFKKLLERSGLPRDVRRRISFEKPTQIRRSKQFKKRFNARRATLIAQTDGEQPVASVVEAHKAFWKKTGKP